MKAFLAVLSFGVLSFGVLSGGCLFLASAASPSIGFVRSSGTFRVDGATIGGNSTLLEGNVVETGAARSIVQVSGVQMSGVQIVLLPDSRARLYFDHAVFEKGSGVASNAGKYTIQAASLRIAPATGASIVQVEMRSATMVAVTATSGYASVRNDAGVLLASLHPGEALTLDPQAGASTAVTMTGIVESKDGKYFLTDLTTHVTVQLDGPEVANFAGKTVAITGASIPGAVPAAGASQLVQVATIKPVSKNRKAAAAAAGGAAAGGAAGGAAAGLSVGATIAIIGGVAIVGTVAGLGVVGEFSSKTSVSAQ